MLADSDARCTKMKPTKFQAKEKKWGKKREEEGRRESEKKN